MVHHLKILFLDFLDVVQLLFIGTRQREHNVATGGLGGGWVLPEELVWAKEIEVGVVGHLGFEPFATLFQEIQQNCGRFLVVLRIFQGDCFHVGKVANFRAGIFGVFYSNP